MHTTIVLFQLTILILVFLGSWEAQASSMPAPTLQHKSLLSVDAPMPAPTSTDAPSLSTTELPASLVSPIFSPTTRSGLYISTFADNSTADSLDNSQPATSAAIHSPKQMWLDESAQFLYFAELGNKGHVVRRVDMSGNGNIISTFAGTCRVAASTGDGGQATAATLDMPTGIWGDSARSVVYISERFAHKIRAVNTSSGIITTYAGTGAEGSSGVVSGKPAVSESLKYPYFLTGDTESGDLYIANYGECKVHKVEFDSQNIVAVAGNGTQGRVDNSLAATEGALDYVVGVYYDAPRRSLYISHVGIGENGRSNFYVRKVDTVTGALSTVAGNGRTGTAEQINGDGGPALSAITYPEGLWASPISGNIFIAGSIHHKIRVVDLKTGLIDTIAGTGAIIFDGDGGLATDSGIGSPSHIICNSDATMLYISDTFNNHIRVMSLALPIKAPTIAPFVIAPNVAFSEVPAAFPTSALSANPSESFRFAPDALMLDLHVGTYLDDDDDDDGAAATAVGERDEKMTSEAMIVNSVAEHSSDTRSSSSSSSSSTSSSSPPASSQQQQPYSAALRSVPSQQPMRVPTSQPSSWPSYEPSSQPTYRPSALLSMCPSMLPSRQPTSQPSIQPTTSPTSTNVTVFTFECATRIVNFQSFDTSLDDHARISFRGVIHRIIPAADFRNVEILSVTLVLGITPGTAAAAAVAEEPRAVWSMGILSPFQAFDISWRFTVVLQEIGYSSYSAGYLGVKNIVENATETGEFMAFLCEKDVRYCNTTVVTTFTDTRPTQSPTNAPPTDWEKALRTAWSYRLAIGMGLIFLFVVLPISACFFAYRKRVDRELRESMKTKQIHQRRRLMKKLKSSNRNSNYRAGNGPLYIDTSHEEDEERSFIDDDEPDLYSVAYRGDDDEERKEIEDIELALSPVERQKLARNGSSPAKFKQQKGQFSSASGASGGSMLEFEMSAQELAAQRKRRREMAQGETKLRMERDKVEYLKMRSRFDTVFSNTNHSNNNNNNNNNSSSVPLPGLYAGISPSYAKQQQQQQQYDEEWHVSSAAGSESVVSYRMQHHTQEPQEQLLLPPVHEEQHKQRSNERSVPIIHHLQSSLPEQTVHVDAATATNTNAGTPHNADIDTVVSEISIDDHDLQLNYTTLALTKTEHHPQLHLHRQNVQKRHHSHHEKEKGIEKGGVPVSGSIVDRDHDQHHHHYHHHLHQHYPQTAVQSSQARQEEEEEEETEKDLATPPPSPPLLLLSTGTEQQKITTTINITDNSKFHAYMTTSPRNISAHAKQLLKEHDYWKDTIMQLRKKVTRLAALSLISAVYIELQNNVLLLDNEFSYALAATVQTQCAALQIENDKLKNAVNSNT